MEKMDVKPVKCMQIYVSQEIIVTILTTTNSYFDSATYTFLKLC